MFFPIQLATSGHFPEFSSRLIVDLLFRAIDPTEPESLRFESVIDKLGNNV